MNAWLFDRIVSYKGLNMQIRIFGLTVFCAAVLVSASLEHAQAQLTPLPDPIGGGGAGTGGTGTGCGCQTRFLSSTAMATIGPDFSVGTIDQDLMPAGFMSDPATDEWSGNDELYRVAYASVKKLSLTSGSIRVIAKQGFEIYDSLPGTDPGFPSTHVHPSASIHGEFEFKTNGLHLDPVGISLNGNVTATGSASVHGSAAAAFLQFGYHADASAGASLNVEASHPFPNCPGGTEKIKETISINGSVNTTETTSGSVSITVGTATKTTIKEKGKVATDNGVTLDATVGLTSSVTLTDTAFSGSAGLTGTLNVVGSTDSPIVRIPVTLVATASGAGTSDGAYSTGNGSASSKFVWSGTAMPCAMQDPTITPPPTTPTPPPTTPTPPPTTPTLSPTTP